MKKFNDVKASYVIIFTEKEMPSLNLKKYIYNFLKEHEIDVPKCSCCGEYLNFDSLLHNVFCRNPKCEETINHKLTKATKLLKMPECNFSAKADVTATNLYTIVVQELIANGLPKNLSLIHYVQALGRSMYDSILKLVFQNFDTFTDFYEVLEEMEDYESRVEYLQRLLQGDINNATEILYVSDMVYVLCQDLTEMREGLLLIDGVRDLDVSVADIEILFSDDLDYDYDINTQFLSRTLSSYIEKCYSDSQLANIFVAERQTNY